MPKATAQHLGGNVFSISCLPYVNQEYSYYDSPEVFDKFLGDLKFKYSIAITANRFQSAAHSILHKHDFEPVLHFYSSHGTHENLTLWLKVEKKSPDLSTTPVELSIPNCTVTYTRSEDRFLRLTVALSEQDAKELAAASYRQLKDTPIWYLIEDKRLLPPEKVKLDIAPKK